MHSYLDAKLMAKSLRQSLAQHKLDLSHSECLEIVARQFGLADWNTLAARIAAAQVDDTPLAMPKAWFVTRQTDPQLYRLGLDPVAAGTALIECRFGRDSGMAHIRDRFAVFMQSVKADEYLGGLVKLTALLSTHDADRGSLWLRVDAPDGRVLQFDNLFHSLDGPLTGTADWTERSIALDVPREAGSIHFGFLLQGYGRIRAKDFRLEAVDAVEKKPRRPHLPNPDNLDFGRPEA